MIQRDPKDYTDMGIDAIRANIDHYNSILTELEEKKHIAAMEYIFWMQVKQLKSVL